MQKLFKVYTYCFLIYNSNLRKKFTKLKVYGSNNVNLVIIPNLSLWFVKKRTKTELPLYYSFSLYLLILHFDISF